MLAEDEDEDEDEGEDWMVSCIINHSKA